MSIKRNRDPEAEARNRTHNLIKLGGMVKIAELDNLEPTVLLGLCLSAKRFYMKLTDAQICKLAEKGASCMKDRKKQNKQKKGIEKTKFVNKDDDKWLL